MNAHTRIEERLPLYAAGQLNSAEQAEIEAHLASCAACREELALWKAVSAEIVASDRALAAPPVLAQRALQQVRGRKRLNRAFWRTWQLLHAQTFLVQRETWPASAAVLVLGVIVALLSNQAGVIYFIAPLVAASTVAMLSGREHDPAYELTVATPTQPWMVLLARLSIVSVYNLVLTLAATLALLLIVPPGLLGTLILGWLAPMAFFSALALLLSLWIGSSNATIFIYVLWIAQYVPYRAVGTWMVSPAWSMVISAYQNFWHNPLLLFLLSIPLAGIALWSANRPVFRLNQGID